MSWPESASADCVHAAPPRSANPLPAKTHACSGSGIFLHSCLVELSWIKSPMQMAIDVFAQIFGTLWAHKLRSFLTMFGIAWGVGSLLLLVGLGEGFRTGNQRNLSEYGENIMMVFPGRAPVVKGSINSAREYRLTYQDYLDIRQESPHIRAVTPVLNNSDVHAVSEFASASGLLTGAEPQ